MFELDERSRDAITREIAEMSTDATRPVSIEADVWDDKIGPEGDWRALERLTATRIVVDAVLDHQLVQLKLNDSDELWDALKWAVAQVPFRHAPPDDVADVVAAVQSFLRSELA